MNNADKKNVLLILVDQLRFPRFCYGEDGGLLPELKEILGFQGDVDGENAYSHFFPGLWTLRKNAVVLRNHTIAASACTPSRCAIMTGQYGTRTGVTQTDGLFKNADAPSFPWLAADGAPTLGDWFRSAGYRTHYFGKWHVSNPPDHTLQDYGFDDWELSWPEPHGASINNLGAYRDYGFADLACTFLRNEGLGMGYNRALAQQEQTAPLADSPPTTPQPWLAVVSLTNPHDIATYPALVRGLDPDAAKLGPLTVPAQGAMSAVPTAGTFSFPLNPQGFPQDNAQLPPGVDEDLSNKPSCQFDYAYKMGLALASKSAQGVHQQANAIDAVNIALKANIPFQLAHDPNDSVLKFIQYYAWLMQMVDGHIARVLGALDDAGQRDNTIVVFMADHGEYAGAHNYMMEKWHTAYQEALHVPVVVQSAAINPANAMRQIDALTSHVDIVPTLLGLAGVTEQEVAHASVKLQADHTVYPLPGANLTSVIMGTSTIPTEPDGTPREGVLFITDDEITQPLQDGGEYQVSNNEAYGVFVQAVEVLREGSGKPNSPRVEGLAPGPVRQPNHVRCVRTPEWKLSRYWDPSHKAADEWELYHLVNDPCEFSNLLVTNAPFPTPIPNPPSPYDQEGIIATAEKLRDLLQKLELSHLSAPSE
ncbi:MAG: sulfatase-like hydrolase/transferase [Methylococcaceae bacterium]|nr:sulfatase-like hydrolase/transferase [Methylococcaceae bacterium]